jgi:uncharacterized protein (TIGR01777 family)
MKIIVAGGRGWLGSHLCRALSAEKHDVVVLTRQHAPTVKPLRFVWWDGRTLDKWLDEIDGADAIVNLSGETIAGGRWTAERKQRLRSSRIQATATLVEAIRVARSRPAMLVNASAVGFYGDRGDETLTEGASAGTDFLADLVVDWEAAAMPAQEMGCRTVLLRMGVVVGPGGGVLEQMVPPFRWFVGGPIGHSNRWLPWIHIDDAVGLAQLALVHEEAQGPLNAVSPNMATYHDFATAIGSALSRPNWLPVPDLALRLLVGEMANALLSSQCVVPAAALRLGYTFRQPDLRSAVADSLRRAV